jgi:hypothetical protein
VTFHFTDRSTTEDGFSIWRVNGNGFVSFVDDIRTTSKAGIGNTFAVVDPNPVQGTPQCYVVIGYDDQGLFSGISDSLCVGPAPLLAKPTMSEGKVSVHFTDRSAAEDGFSIMRVNGNGSPFVFNDIRTTSKASTGTSYTVVDSNPGQGSPLCYRVGEYDNNAFQDALSDVQCVG